jgi:hypothetical protein
MERTGIEPVTSGLQSQSIARRRLTLTDKIAMTEPNFVFSANLIRHGSTPVRSHRARTGES